MVVSSPSSAAYQSARRFIGRRAAVCRKHGDPGQQHHVNRMGGLVCSACNPPRTDADCVLRLVISGGMWDDADNPFDFQGGESGESRFEEEGHGPRAATPPAPKNTNAMAAQKSATNFDETTTSELATPRDSAEQRTSRRVGEPLLELEIDFFMAWPDVGMPEVVNASEIGREPADKERQREERAGLLESSALGRGFVGGTVRRGEGFGLSSDPLRNPTINTQFAVGQVVRLLRRLETFREALQPRGGYVVSSVGKDFEGCPLLALSLGGMVVVSGLVPDSATIGIDEVVSIDELIG